MPGGPVLVTTLEDAHLVLRDNRRFPIPFDASRRVPTSPTHDDETGARLQGKATPPLSAAAVGVGRDVFAAELSAAWPDPDVEVVVDALRMLRRPVSRSTTAALVERADEAARDHVAELTLAWVDALGPVISAARPPRRWSRARRREQHAVAQLRAALRDLGYANDAALATALAAGVQVPIAGGAWVMCQLAGHPALADEAHGDADVALAMVWETLRLYPPTWLLPRMVSEDVVMGGVALPAYTPLVVSPRALGQLPAVAPGPDAGQAPLAEFDPGRWKGRSERPGAWLPFGAGPHACPGRNLALAQLCHLVVVASGRRLSLPGPVRIDARRGLAPSPALVRVAAVEKQSHHA